MPTWLGLIPGMEAMVSGMMKKEMDKLDVPPVDEFLDMIVAGGGEIYACKMAADMFKLEMKLSRVGAGDARHWEPVVNSTRAEAAE